MPGGMGGMPGGGMPDMGGATGSSGARTASPPVPTAVSAAVLSCCSRMCSSAQCYQRLETPADGWD